MNYCLPFRLCWCCHQQNNGDSVLLVIRGYIRVKALRYEYIKFRYIFWQRFLLYFLPRLLR